MKLYVWLTGVLFPILSVVPDGNASKLRYAWCAHICIILYYDIALMHVRVIMMSISMHDTVHVYIYTEYYTLLVIILPNSNSCIQYTATQM